MTAADTLEAARRAYREDRPLSAAEFDAIREVLADRSFDMGLMAARGELRELSQAIERQAGARQERNRVAEQQRQAAERQRQLDAREESWQRLDPMQAALYLAISENPSDPALRALLRHYGAKREQAPDSFQSEVLPEYRRRFFG